MDILDCIEFIISVVKFGLLVNVAWLPHLVGCKFHDLTWDKPEERLAAIELLAETLGKTYEEGEAIVKAFAHGDYGM